MKTKQDLLTKKELLDIFVNHRTLSSLPGDWESISKGSGYEFSDLREMEPSDPMKSVDWKATAKTGRYHVREYQAETYSNLMILYDISKSVAFGRKEMLQANIAASLAYTAAIRNYQCGLILFADKVTGYIPPRMGYEQFMKVLDTIVRTEPEDCLKTDLNAALARLISELSESLTFILSDFMYLPESLHNIHCPRLGKNCHEVIALRIAEESELRLPQGSKGIMPLYDYETGKYALLDPGKWKIYNRCMQQKSENIKKILSAAGIACETITPADDFRMKIHGLIHSRC